MLVKICKNYGDMSQVIAKILVSKLINFIDKNGFATLIPSAGKTMSLAYDILCNNYKHKVDWSKVIIIQMDEYCSIEYIDNSFAKFIFEKLITPLDIKNYSLITSNRYNLNNEIFATYRKHIRKYGNINIALHGIGVNGHIGFNEPPIRYECDLYKLAAETLNANKGSFINKNNIPEYGVTLTLQELMRVEYNIIAASGKSKHNALKTILHLEFNKNCPASVLTTCDSHTEVVCDVDALWGHENDGYETTI